MSSITISGDSNESNVVLDSDSGGISSGRLNKVREDQMQANISANASGIAANASAIATNASSIAANEAYITTNAASALNNLNDVSANAAAAAANAAGISTSAQLITANAVDILALQNTAVLTDPTLPTLEELGLTAQYNYGTFELSTDASGVAYSSNKFATTSYTPMAENIEKLNIPVTENAHLYNPAKFQVTIVTNNKIGSSEIVDSMRTHYTKAANFLAKNELPLSPMTTNLSKESSDNFKYNGVAYVGFDTSAMNYVYQPSPIPPTPGVYTLIMKDSYGDGWQGAEFNIYDMSGTALDASGQPIRGSLLYTNKLASGGYAAVTIPSTLFDGSLNVEVTDDSWDSEVTWDLIDSSAATVLSGGSNYNQWVHFPVVGTPKDLTPVPMAFENVKQEQPASLSVNGNWLSFWLQQPSITNQNIRGYLYLKDLDNGVGYFHFSSSDGCPIYKMTRVATKNDCFSASNAGKVVFHYDEDTMEVTVYGQVVKYSQIINVTNDSFDPSNASYSPVAGKIGKQAFIDSVTSEHISEYTSLMLVEMACVKNVNGNLKKCNPKESAYGVQTGRVALCRWLTNGLSYFLDASGMLQDDYTYPSYPKLATYAYLPSPKVVQGETVYAPSTNGPTSGWGPMIMNAYYKPSDVGTWRGAQFVPYNYGHEGSQNILHPVNGTSFNAWAWNGPNNSGIQNAKVDSEVRFGKVNTINQNFFTTLLPANVIGKDPNTHQPACNKSFDAFNSMVALHEYTHTLQQSVQGGWMGVQEDGGCRLCATGIAHYDHEHTADTRLTKTRDPNLAKITRGIWGIEMTAVLMEKIIDYSPNVGTFFRMRGPYVCLNKILDGTFFYDVATAVPSYDAVSHGAILEDLIHTPGNNNIDGTPKRELLNFNFNFTKDKHPLASKNNKPAPGNTDTLFDIANQLVTDSHDLAVTWKGSSLFGLFKEVYGYTGYDFQNQAYLYAGRDNTANVGLKYQVLRIATMLAMSYNKSQRPDIPDDYKVGEHTIIYDLEYGSDILDLADDVIDRQISQYVDIGLANLPPGWFANTDPNVLKAHAKGVLRSMWGRYVRNDIQNFRISRTLKTWNNDVPLARYEEAYLPNGLQAGKPIRDTSANGLEYMCNSFCCFGLNKFYYSYDASGAVAVDASGAYVSESSVSQFSIKAVNVDASGAAVNVDTNGSIALRLFCFNKKLASATPLEMQSRSADVPFAEANVTIALNGPAVPINMYTLLGIDGVADKSDYNINCIFANLSENPSVKIVLDSVVSTDMAL